MEQKLQQNAYSGAEKILKITVFGPESTGKTTLCKVLATHFETVWAPEFARDYLQEKWDVTKTVCQPDDLLPIAIGQMQLENDNVLLANKILFCDTSLLVTKIFSEMYYNFCDPVLDKAATNHNYDLFFLTNVDVPWKADDLRDKPNNREQTFDVFKQTLIQHKKPFVILSGNETNRLEKAIAVIQDLRLARSNGFSSLDFVQMYNDQIPVAGVLQQLNFFRNGIPKVELESTATIENGILSFDESQKNQKLLFFEQNKHLYKLKKMVPASGAASRMFKFLQTFLKEFKPETQTINEYINKNKASDLSVFLVGLEKFPFFDAVFEGIKKNREFSIWNKDQRDYNFIKTMLSPTHFDFANKPKGVLPFHKTNQKVKTAIHEHLIETAAYANSKSVANIHFTVSPEHRESFEKIVGKTKLKIEQKTFSNIAVKYSYQSPSTNTIAVDLQNNPLRNENQKLIFRPGGHGALLENLNNLEADLVFIKNIDNVSPNDTEEVSRHKKILAGHLMEIQQKVFGFLLKLESTLTETEIQEITLFSKQNLNILFTDDFEKFTLDNKISALKQKLNRPIRVCGMVKNEGEPGGGPFWIADKRGNVSLQIVESSQVDLNNHQQKQILKKSTHFNPVDLVCGIKDYKNQKFDLKNFVDNNTGFIVEKNKNGQDLKGYELPGLWNGAMAKWITVFVEMPLLTFNPVKTVNDLLKPAHQTMS
jgi:nicotinamide riboside kinase